MSATYQRNTVKQNPNQPNPAEILDKNEKRDEQIKVDGFAQVLAMLKIADPEFRESILKRLAARDPALAKSLRADLAR